MEITAIRHDITHSELLKDEVAFSLFFYLLTFANFSDEDNIKRGQIHTSLSALASHLGFTKRRIETALKKMQMLHLVRQEMLQGMLQKGSVLTLCNYDTYIGYPKAQCDKMCDKQCDIPKENFPPTPPLKENNIYNPLTLAGEPPLKKTPKEIFDEVVDMWHAICVDLPQVRVRNATRQKKVLCRVSEMGGYEKALPLIEEIFRTAQSISFYNGDNNRGWKASFDWFFENDTNWAKVLERVHQNGQRTYTNSNTEQARIIQERREQHLHDIERIQSDYLSKIGR